MAVNNKFVLFSLLFIFLLSISVMSEHSGFSTGEWGLAGNLIGERSFVSEGEATADFADGYDSETSLSYGIDATPLLIDMDNDDVNELIIASGTTLYFAYSAEGALTLEDSVNIGGTITSQYTGIYRGDGTETDFNGDGYKEVVVVTDNKISVVQYNATTGNYMIIQNQTYGGNNIKTGVSCGVMSAEWLCFFGDNSTNVIKYHLSNNTVKIYDTGETSGMFDTDYGYKISPAFQDIDRDSTMEVVFVADANNDNSEGVIVIDSTLNVLDTGFSTDGILDDIYTGYVAGLTIVDLDDVGDLDIVLTGLTGTDAYLKTYNSVGTAVFSNQKQLTGGVSVVSMPVAQSFVNTSQFSLCYFVKGGTNEGYECTDLAGNSERDNSAGGGNIWSGGTPTRIIGGNYLHTDFPNNYQLVVGGYVWNLTGADESNYRSKHAVSVSGSARDSYNMIGGYFDDDLTLDICGMTTGTVFCSMTDLNSTAPTLLSRNFGQNYKSPICIGTTVTFTAVECATSNPTTCHYTNDITGEKERLISNCGGTSVLNGTFALGSLSLGCTFNSEGNFGFPIYLQDETNDEDLTQYQTISLFIKNGTAGETCNLPVTQEDLDGKNNTVITATDDFTDSEDVTEFFDMFTGQNSEFKIFLCIMFTIMTIGFLVVKGVTSPIIYSIVILAIWILLALIGLLSWIYIMFFAFIALAISIMSYVSGGNNNNG